MESKPCATCQAPIEQSRTYCGTACRIEGLKRRNQVRAAVDAMQEWQAEKANEAAERAFREEPQRYIPPQDDDWRRPQDARAAMESWHRRPMIHGR